MVSFKRVPHIILAVAVFGCIAVWVTSRSRKSRLRQRPCSKVRGNNNCVNS